MFRKLFSLTRFLPKEAWTFLRYIKIFKPLFLFVSLQICWREKDFFTLFLQKFIKILNTITQNGADVKEITLI